MEDFLKRSMLTVIPFSKGLEDMESRHIEETRLREIVAVKDGLSPSEVEHLKICEQCLESIRSIVRQQIHGS